MLTLANPVFAAAFHAALAALSPANSPGPGGSPVPLLAPGSAAFLSALSPGVLYVPHLPALPQPQQFMIPGAPRPCLPRSLLLSLTRVGLPDSCCAQAMVLATPLLLRLWRLRRLRLPPPPRPRPPLRRRRALLSAVGELLHLASLTASR